MRRHARLPLAAAALLAATIATPAHAADGLRVATWNITYYAGDRAPQIGTVAYGQWGGKQMDPDLICLQEMTSRSAVTALVAALNNAPGSPGDWQAAPVFLAGTLSNALVYRSSKLTLDSVELVSQGSGPPNHPRNVVRHDFRPAGYPEDASIISVFPQHFKAGANPSDFERRALEARIIADHIATLPAGRAVVFGADLNTPSGSDEAYQNLTGVIPNTGVLRDPIGRIGTWKNNIAYRMIHTQDPTSTAGMDDRYDQVLLSPSLIDGRGMDYDGDPNTPWNLALFEDPNHSYRAWGNDGSTYNAPLRIAGNMMVGPTIAQAIQDMADPDGHIPVFLDLDMPPRVQLSQTTIDLGTVSGTAQGQILVSNAGDTALWGLTGIAPLQYTLESDDPALSIPTGEFQAQAGNPGNEHIFELTLPANTPAGTYNTTIRVVSDDPATPTAEIAVTYTVGGCNPADIEPPYGTLNFFDVASFIDFYNSADPVADFAAPFGVLDFFDIAAFLDAYNNGCP